MELPRGAAVFYEVRELVDFDAVMTAAFIWLAMGIALVLVGIPYFWRRCSRADSPSPRPEEPEAPTREDAGSPDGDGRCRCSEPRVVTEGTNVLEWRCEVCGGRAVYDRTAM